MRYSTEPGFWKYVKEYGFWSFAKKFGDKYGKKIMNAATKTRDLIGNEIADKITSIGKPKENEETNKVEEIYISTEKRQQIIEDLRLF